ncbi:unnamed protein product, partial [Didymodactylos carnosus]
EEALARPPRPPSVSTSCGSCRQLQQELQEVRQQLQQERQQLQQQLQQQSQEIARFRRRASVSPPVDLRRRSR